MSARADLMTLIEVGADDCWYWQGYVMVNGYGKVGRRLAHRAMYEERVGPIPAGLVLDHLCRHRSCVNPAHLEPVTQRENTRRGDNAASTRARANKATHCKHGHEFTPENTRVYRGVRHCRTCAVIYTLRWRAKPRGPVTECVHGHAYTLANTYTDPSGQRSCRECRRIRGLAAYYKMKRDAA